MDSHSLSHGGQNSVFAKVFKVGLDFVRNERAYLEESSYKAFH